MIDICARVNLNPLWGAEQVWLVAAEGVDIHNDEQAQKAHFPFIGETNT